jgi:hypothetical protein
MSLKKIWELLKRFKKQCNCLGWKTSENEDWVEINNKYHNFVLVNTLYPSTFERITSNRKCAIRDGISYRVVETDYMAWLLSSSPDKSLWKLISENPEILTKTAIYDLSPILKGKSFCLKLNQTKSPVFQEFEKFLQENGIETRPLRSNEEHKYALALH